MNKKRWSLIAAVFFLVQVILCTQILSAETCPINPLTEVNIRETQIPGLKIDTDLNDTDTALRKNIFHYLISEILPDFEIKTRISYPYIRSVEGSV